MNTVNSSLGFSGFQLRSGFSPRLIPPLVPATEFTGSNDKFDAHELLTTIQVDVLEAQDNLLRAKLDHVRSHNHHRRADPGFEVGQRVLLKTMNQKNEYKL
ncbi:hypothetical protein GG344DRAFT_54689 [Lentinula edodes]|nr:hypothetical protein GG344DRAFT_54689 [Lentinula edodes]